MGQDMLVGALIAVSMIFPMAWLLHARLSLSTTVHWHRGLAHGAVQFVYPLRLYFEYTGARVGVWVRYWVFVHVDHHANTDTENDPHAPSNLLDGSISDIVARWRDALKRHLKTNYPEYRDYATVEQVMARKDPGVTFIDTWARWCKQHPPLQAVTFVWLWLTHMVPYALVGWLLGVNMLAYALPMGLAAIASLFIGGRAYIHSSSRVNTAGHAWWVRSPLKSVGHASNSVRDAVRAFGEGFQYWHHLRQRAARLRVKGLSKWYHDIGWVFIATARFLRLTKFVHEDPHGIPVTELEDRMVDRRMRPIHPPHVAEAA